METRKWQWQLGASELVEWWVTEREKVSSACVGNWTVLGAWSLWLGASASNATDHPCHIGVVPSGAWT
jgi:hypothetical protein